MTNWTPLISAEGIGGVNHYSRPDGAGGLEILSVQDVSAVVEHAKAQALHNDGYSADRTMRRVAIIPAVIEQRWIDEGWYPHDKARLARVLNDPDWAHLRTADGRVACVNGVLR